MQETQEIELKPCPFCGDEAIIDKIPNTEFNSGKLYYEYRIECKDCYIQTVSYEIEQEAIKAWNQRASDLPKTGLSEAYFASFNEHGEDLE